MIASAPSSVVKHAAKRPSDANQQIIGQMPVDLVHSDIVSNGLGKTAVRFIPGCMTCRIRNVTFSVLKALVKLASACGLGVWDGAQSVQRLCECVIVSLCDVVYPLTLGASQDPAVVIEIQRRIRVHLASFNIIKPRRISSYAATPDPQPSSTSASDLQGGAIGATGASYGGPSFLSFADLIGTTSSSDNEAQTFVEAPDDLSEDGSREDDTDMSDSDMSSPWSLCGGDLLDCSIEAPTSVVTHVNNNQTRLAIGYRLNPNDPSFGTSYPFDRTFQDVGLDVSSTGSLVSAENNPAVNPLGTDAFSMAMALLGVETLADVPAAIEANANTTDPTLIAALQQLRIGIAPLPPIESQPMYVAPFGNQHLQLTARQMELLHLYKNDLCNLQYHIAHSADSSIADELFDVAMHSEAALFGTLTLTALYKLRLRGGGPDMPSEEEMVEVRGFMERASKALEQKDNTSMLDSGDAMGALHMVSAVLFDGGTSADWDKFLDIAKAYVAKHPIVNMKSWHSSPITEGSSSTAGTPPAANAPTPTADKMTQFIIKTVAWFDVIGSVTMRRAPFFLDTYREPFGREGGAAMERIMGCNEKVLLAIAETAALAAWRREEERNGTLSYMKLAKRAIEIEDSLSFTGPPDNGSDFDEYYNMGEPSAEQESLTRTVRLMSNVFRATGRLYLHTVLSQCNPDVQDIKDAVQSTIEAFKALQASDFDRSLVFPITLAGCMTDNREHRMYLEGRLLQLGPKGQAVGNSGSCLKLMQAVWKKRDRQLTGPRIVDWVDTMNDLGWCLLLV